MKNILIKALVASMFLLIVFPSSAQNDKFEKEAFAGVTLSNYVGDDAENFDIKPGFNVGITGRYYFVKNLFVEGSLVALTQGYKNKTVSTSGSVWDDEGGNYDSEIKTTFNTYNLALPVLVGYRFNLSDDINVKIKVGPYVSYVLSGDKKEKGYTIIYPDIHSSEKEYINETTKLSDIEDFEKLEYGAQAAVSVEYKRFLVNASFQRSFRKQFDDDCFSQNINISLGYRF